MSVGPSVGRSVGRSVRRSVGPSVGPSHFTFFRKVAYRVTCARLMAIGLVPLLFSRMHASLQRYVGFFLKNLVSSVFFL